MHHTNNNAAKASPLDTPPAWPTSGQLLRRLLLSAATAEARASCSSRSPCSALRCRARVNSDNSLLTVVLPPAATVRLFFTLHASQGCCGTGMHSKFHVQPRRTPAAGLGLNAAAVGPTSQAGSVGWCAAQASGHCMSSWPGPSSTTHRQGYRHQLCLSR